MSEEIKKQGLQELLEWAEVRLGELLTSRHRLSYSDLEEQYQLARLCCLSHGTPWGVVAVNVSEPDDDNPSRFDAAIDELELLEDDMVTRTVNGKTVNCFTYGGPLHKVVAFHQICEGIIKANPDINTQAVNEILR